VLVKAKADVNALDSKGRNALNLLCTVGGDSTAARLLINAGCDVNHADDHKITPLMGAAAAGASDLLSILCKAGAEIDRQNTNGETALDRAVFFNKADIVRYLLQKGADGRAALLAFAGLQDRREAVKALINGGVEVNITDKRGYTPLRVAVERGDREIVKLLIEKGADVNAKVSGLNSILELAERKGYYDIAFLLKNTGAH
jgi:cytohesin